MCSAAKGLDSLDASDSVWIGSNPQKGLGVFSFNGYTLEVARASKNASSGSLRSRSTDPSASGCSVWSMNHRADVRLESHALVSLAALDVYREWYQGQPLVMAGDFNSNVIWNPTAGHRKPLQHIAACEDVGLVSAYHSWTGDEQGAEREPTIYWRNRTIDGPRYHIDYAFVPRRLAARISSMQVGTHADWVATGRSDHVPLVFDFDLVPSSTAVSV